MEKKFYTDNFERLLKEKSDEFRMYPSKRVWHSIYNDLHPGRKWPSIAMSMMLVIALLLIGSLNTNDNSIKTSIANASDAQNAASKNKIASTQHSPRNDNRNSQQNNLASTGIPAVENGLNAAQVSGSGNDGNTTAADINSGTGGTTLANSNDPATYLNERNTSQNNSQNNSGRNNQAESMDYYIKSNQLFADVNGLNKQKDGRNTNATSSLKDGNTIKDENITGINAANLQNTIATTSTSSVKTQDENKVTVTDEKTAAKANLAVSNKNPDPNDQKAWMEDYALHNKAQRKKWKDRVAMELYVTPSVGYRNMSSNINNPAAAQSYAAPSGSSNNRTVSQKPSLNLEAGFDLAYSVAKNLRVKTGVQVNYTSYGINADQTNHPIATTLLLNDPNTGLPYLTARTSTLANSSGLQPVTIHNTTYQISVPVGLAVKIAGNSKMEWHAGASIQPSFVFGGMTNFISSDYSSYVSDASLLRKWNMNAGVESYLSYKMKGFNLQVGPQFRYQLFSTYTKQYTNNENLYNVGLKVGLVKHF